VFSHKGHEKRRLAQRTQREPFDRAAEGGSRAGVALNTSRTVRAQRFVFSAAPDRVAACFAGRSVERRRFVTVV
jgi:hypothetical protein